MFPWLGVEYYQYSDDISFTSSKNRWWLWQVWSLNRYSLCIYCSLSQIGKTAHYPSELHHVTPLVNDLYWFPIDFHVQFKVLVITFKILHDTGQVTYGTTYPNDFCPFYWIWQDGDTPGPLGETMSKYWTLEERLLYHVICIMEQHFLQRYG